MTKIKINNFVLEVEDNITILEAAKKIGIKIPTLCFHEDLKPSGNCGLCVVELKGGKMVRACSTPVSEGMDIITNSPSILSARKTVLELILSNHPNNCLECIKNQKCELQKAAYEMNIIDTKFTKILRPIVEKDTSSNAITLSPAYCIQCGRCVEVCQVIQNVHALEYSNRGFDTFVGPTMERKLEESECVKCGQCSSVCPVGAIYEKDDSEKVWEALSNPDLVLVAQEAPAVRVAIGEEFGFPVGTNVVKKMYTALRRLGFKYVFDTNFGADLTICEEAKEFEEWFTKCPEKLPLITTCCPSWVDYLEKFFYDLIPHFSSAKSPHQMLGAMVKTYWAKKMGILPNKIFLVSIMPCTAKKYEIDRIDDMYSSGTKDVNATITTREFARMLKVAGIDLASLPESEADNPLGGYSGAGTIFGASGGVMEAALRTAYFYLTGKELDSPEIKFVRGIDGIKEGEIDILGKRIRIAVASGLGNVEKILNKVREAKRKGEPTPYHFIEVMACRGGCVGGGGQPYGSTLKVREQRAKGLYNEDETLTIRQSHNNPSIKKLYEDFLEKPNSHIAHKYLHTHYVPRPLYKGEHDSEWVG
ncbi:MAG: NADH-dependent [FeFe] hydrogenase, group A6 [Spirochaetes bacterium]|nr:NADH-dependent [FeFe] hydrogenase, group A6 [Spirochaetota bacterium]